MKLIKTEKIHFTSKVFALSWSQKVYKWQTHNLRTQVSLFLNRRCLHFYKGILILYLQHKHVSNCKNSSRWEKFLGGNVFLEIFSNGILVPIVVFLSHNVTTNNFYWICIWLKNFNILEDFLCFKNITRCASFPLRDFPHIIPFSTWPFCPKLAKVSDDQQ